MLFPLKTYAVENKNYEIAINQNTVVQKIVGSIQGEDITLYATEKEGELTDFKLKAKGYTYSFPRWINVSNETYYPQLLFNDIDNDGVKELIIVLTTDTGSEVAIQQVHVFNIENNGEVFEEILVDNPLAIINKNVKTKLTKSQATISIGNRVTKINIEKLGIVPSHMFPNVAFGSILKFEVINNTLTAKVAATISPSGGYLGDIVITYILKDNMFQAENISFAPNKY